MADTNTERVEITVTDINDTSKQRSYQNGIFFSTLDTKNQQLDAGGIVFFLNMNGVITCGDNGKVAIHKKTGEFGSIINDNDYAVGDVLKGYVTPSGNRLIEKYTNAIDMFEEAYSIKINDNKDNVKWMTITKLINTNIAVGSNNVQFIVGNNIIASNRTTNWDVIDEIYNSSNDDDNIGTLSADKIGNTLHFKRSNIVMPEILDFFDKDTANDKSSINGLLHPSIWNSTSGEENSFRYTINLPIYGQSTTISNSFANSFANMPATMRCFTFLYFFLFPPTFENASPEVQNAYTQYFYPGTTSATAMPKSPNIKKLHRSELMRYYRIYHIDSLETRTMNFSMLDYIPMVFDSAGKKLNHHAVCTIKDNVSGNVYLLIPRFILRTNSSRAAFEFIPKHIIWRAKSILIENNTKIPNEYKLLPVINSDGDITKSVLKCFALDAYENDDKCKKFFRNTFFFENNYSHIFTDSKDVIVALKVTTDSKTEIYPLPQGSMFSILTAKVPTGRVVSNNQAQSRLVFRMRWQNGDPIKVETGDDTTTEGSKKPQQVFLIKIGYELKEGESFIFIPANSLKDHYCNLDKTSSNVSGNIKNYPWHGESSIDYGFFGFNYGVKSDSADTAGDILKLSDGKLFPNGVIDSYTDSNNILEIIPRHNNRRSIWFKFKPKKSDFDLNFTIDEYNMLEDIKIIDLFKRNGEGSYMIFDENGQLVKAVANKTGVEKQPKHISVIEDLNIDSWYYMIYEYPAEGYLDSVNKSSYMDIEDNTDYNINGITKRPGTSSIREYTSIKKLDNSIYFSSVGTFFDDAEKFQSRYDGNHNNLISDVEAVTVKKNEIPVSERTDIYLFDKTTFGPMINDDEPYYRFQTNGYNGSTDANVNYNFFIGGNEADTITKYSNQLNKISTAYSESGGIREKLEQYTSNSEVQSMFINNAILKQKLIAEYILPDADLEKADTYIINFISPINCQAIALFFEGTQDNNAEIIEYVDIFYTNKINNNDFKLDTKYSFSVHLTSYEHTLNGVTRQLKIALLMPERNDYDDIFKKDLIANVGANRKIVAYKIIY